MPRRKLRDTAEYQSIYELTKMKNKLRSELANEYYVPKEALRKLRLDQLISLRRKLREQVRKETEARKGL